jgi:hypothetical protein
VKMKVFEPVETTGLSSGDVAALREQVRLVIIQQIAAWRGSAPEVVGGTTFADAAS